MKYLLALLVLFFGMNEAVSQTDSLLFAQKIGNVLYIAKKYNQSYDIIYTFDYCMYNQLYSFKTIALYANTADSINENVTRPYTTIILNAATNDNIGPVGLNVENKGYWTGGNHSYIMEGDTLKTAKTNSIEVFVDGIFQDDDFSLYTTEIKINVFNELYFPPELPTQNTCINESVEYRINKDGINVHVTHDILRPLNIVLYYGMQSVYNTALQKKIFILNSQYADELDMVNGIYSGIISDYPHVYKVRHSNLSKSICQEMTLKTDEGLFAETALYINPTNSFHRVNTAYGKTYFTQIRNKYVNSGDSYYWKGRYAWYDLNEIQIFAPINLSLSYESQFGTLHWEDSVSAIQYNIYRSTDPHSGFSLIGTSTLPSYIDTDISGSTKYFYQVTAVYSKSGEK